MPDVGTLITDEDLHIRVVHDAIVTAASFEETSLRGAVYGRQRLIPESRRESVNVQYMPVDAELFNGDVPMTRLEGTYLYAGWLHFHFGHFLLESICRLWPLGWLGDDVKVLYHPFAGADASRVAQFDFITTTFAALGVWDGRAHSIVRDSVVETLAVPTPAFRINNSAHPVMSTVYDTMLMKLVDRDPVPGVPTPRRIYLSRRLLPPGPRPYTNEDTLEAAFQDHGFAILFPERLTLKEQIRLMAGADVIAGLNGSALHLAAFARAGSTVVVVRVRETALHNQLALGQLRGARTITFDAGVEDWTIHFDRAALHSVLRSAGFGPTSEESRP